MSHLYTENVACPQGQATTIKALTATRLGYEYTNEGPSTVRLRLGAAATALIGTPIAPGGKHTMMADGWTNDGVINGGQWAYLATELISVYPIDDRQPGDRPTTAATRDNVSHLHEILV